MLRKHPLRMFRLRTFRLSAPLAAESFTVDRTQPVEEAAEEPAVEQTEEPALPAFLDDSELLPEPEASVASAERTLRNLPSKMLSLPLRVHLWLPAWLVLLLQLPQWVPPVLLRRLPRQRLLAFRKSR